MQTLFEEELGMCSTVWVLLACQSACVSILMPCWQDSSAWLRRKLNCNAVHWMRSWCVASYHRRQCWLGSLSPHKMLKQFQPVLFIFSSNVFLSVLLCDSCVTFCCFRLNETLWGFVFTVFVRRWEKLKEVTSKNKCTGLCFDSGCFWYL